MEHRQLWVLLYTVVLLVGSLDGKLVMDEELPLHQKKSLSLDTDTASLSLFSGTSLLLCRIQPRSSRRRGVGCADGNEISEAVRVVKETTILVNKRVSADPNDGHSGFINPK